MNIKRVSFRVRKWRRSPIPNRFIKLDNNSFIKLDNNNKLIKD